MKPDQFKVVYVKKVKCKKCGGTIKIEMEWEDYYDEFGSKSSELAPKRGVCPACLKKRDN